MDRMYHMTVSDILTLFCRCECELRQTGEQLLQRRTMIQRFLTNSRTTPDRREFEKVCRSWEKELRSLFKRLLCAVWTSVAGSSCPGLGRFSSSSCPASSSPADTSHHALPGCAPAVSQRCPACLCATEGILFRSFKKGNKQVKFA